MGSVWYGIPSGDADRTAYVNYLIDMAPGDDDAALGQLFDRSLNTFGFASYTDLPNASLALNGTGTGIDFGSNSYSYLFAKYDGPNWGSYVWYVGDLSGVNTIPALGGEKYGLSGWTLFGPSGSTVRVPEPGTLALLGLGALGLAFARRRALR